MYWAPALAQGPVFVTSPNTNPAGTLLTALSYVHKGDETDLNLSANAGVRRGLTVGLGAMVIDSGVGSFGLARIQLQGKWRFFLREHDGVRKMISWSLGVGLPLGGDVIDLARATGTSRINSAVTAGYLGHRTSFYLSGLYTLDAHAGHDRSTGTAGAVISWRPRPAPPGQTGGPGLTLFGETLLHYEANHSGWFALAPALIYKLGDAQFRAGVRAPVRRWNSTSSTVFTVATSMYVRLVPQQR